MKLQQLILGTCLCLLTACTNGHKTGTIAHRGFWNTDGSAQNSIASLVKADSIGCYGSELDVWMTNDGQLVVNHDHIFKGVEIQEADSRTCTSLVLDNGEALPTLQQYLAKAQSLDVRLIIELKSHKTPLRETEAAQKVVDMVHEMGLDDRVEYIAFSQHATREFIRLAPEGTPVYYLNGDLTPQELKAMGCTGPDYHLGVFKKHPEWIAECHDLGMKVNVWTVNNADDMRWMLEHGVDYITTDEPVLLETIKGGL